MKQLGQTSRGSYICLSSFLIPISTSPFSRPSVSGLRKQWCPEIVDLVERMWAQDHTDRPTMIEVVEELETLYKKYR